MPEFLNDELSVRPDWRITADGQALTGLDERLMSLTLTDNRGFEADQLELVIDDADGQVALPARGTRLSVWLGWERSALTSKGDFTVDEITHSGPPDKLTVTARSADFREEFNVKREYSWHDVKVGDVVSAIAGRYGLKPAVSQTLKDIEIDHADQTTESDMSFLTRMAEELGAIATIKNGFLLFTVPGAGVSASGRVLPVIFVTRQSGDSHNFRVADRDAYTGVQAYWLDLNFGKKPATTVKRKKKKTEPASSKKEGDYVEGAEGNVFTIRKTFKTERAARRAAAAKWRELQRGAAEFSITLARGRPDLYPELHANVAGFKQAIDAADWIISRVVHVIDENGYTTQLELEVRITGWGDAEVKEDGDEAVD